MVQPTYPGVYVEEISSGVRPITAASTSTAAFIGQTQKGSLTEAVRIFNFTQFQNLYGDFIPGLHLAHSVFQYFNNGGSQCYIVRVAGTNVETANIVINDRVPVPDTDPSITVEAVSPGVWGNNIEIRITDGTTDPGNEFNIEVYMDDELVPREQFENLSMVPDTANFVESVTSTSNFIRVAIHPSNDNAVAGTSLASAAPILPPTAGHTRLRINIDGDGYREIDLQTAVTAGAVPNLNDTTNLVTAFNAVVGGDVPSGIPGLTKLRASTDQDAFNNFAASIVGGVLVLSSGTTVAGSSVNVSPAAEEDQNITGFLSIGTMRGGTETLGGAITRPLANTEGIPGEVPRYLVGDHVPASADAVDSVVSGSDGDPITSDTNYTNAFPLLDSINDVSLIAVPGIGSPVVVSAGMNYCENRSLSDCFFIGDMAQDDFTVGDARDFVSNISPKNSYGAVYMPWLLALDPTGVSAEPLVVPPSGYIAGMYAKTDAKRGVWKAPAGTEAGLAGATGLVANLTDVEHGLLNPSPNDINVIRQFASSGRVIWGARTQASDAEWRYVPVRRTAIMLRVSIYRGIQWAVFEPNDEPLWTQLKLNITSFMMPLYRQGAFQGSSAEQAFFVKCDSETTTQDDINNGIVNVLVGFAPLKPAEFIIVKISQKAGQSG